LIKKTFVFTNPNAFQIGIVWYLSQKMKEYGGEHLFLYLKNYDLFVYHATTSQDLKEQIFKGISV
jgi:hypothetical protein